MRMNWLLRLYPPAWQRRYRREVAEHLSAEPASLRTAFDLLAGAVDAWTNPNTIPVANEDEGGTEMITASRCQSVDISTADAARSAGWMIGVTLVLTVLATSADKLYGPHIAIEALLYSAFFIALTISSRSTYLRPYSWAARNVIIGLICLGWYAFFFATIMLGTRI
jgi:hypothetical protein